MLDRVVYLHCAERIILARTRLLGLGLTALCRLLVLSFKLDGDAIGLLYALLFDPDHAGLHHL